MSDPSVARPEEKGAKKTATLSREVSELLVELSIAIHRFGMYPPGHSSLQPMAERLLEHLRVLLEHRERVAIGVAQSQLVIEGVATDENHPVLARLAQRLHDHQLAAITFERQIEQPELEEMLAALAKEAGEEAPGLGGRADQPRWKGVRLFGLGYGQLGLEEARGDPSTAHTVRASELWLGLARSAMASTEAFSGGAPSAGEVAESISAHKREAAYDQVIVGHMLQLSEEVKGGAKEAADVLRHVSELIDALDEGTPEKLLEMGGDHHQRRRFVLNASESLAAESVVKVLKAAASTTGQSISQSMQRLLAKLAVHAEAGGAGSLAQDALRQNVEDLLADWELEDPNPDAYNLVLDGMAAATPALALHPDLDEAEHGPSGAERLVLMSLEIDAFGPIVQRAISSALADGKWSRLMALLSVSQD